MADTYHLLAFISTTLNTTIPFILPSQDVIAQRQQRPKTRGFWTDVFPYLNDEGGYNSFRKHFRITLATFNSLVARLSTHPAFSSDAPNATPVWKQIAIVLWRLANSSGIQVLKQTLGISQGSVIHFTDRFLEALLDLEKERIKWPQGARLAEVTHGFEYGKSGFENRKLPNVIGAIDGTHIPIHRPSKNGIRFINHKNFYFINLLGIVDHQGCFIFIHVGEA
ncbi:21185_t:CDS:1, partial [Cetraspora pellucida]